MHALWNHKSDQSLHASAKLRFVTNWSPPRLHWRKVALRACGPKKLLLKWPQAARVIFKHFKMRRMLQPNSVCTTQNSRYGSRIWALPSFARGPGLAQLACFRLRLHCLFVSFVWCMQAALAELYRTQSRMQSLLRVYKRQISRRNYLALYELATQGNWQAVSCTLCAVESPRMFGIRR